MTEDPYATPLPGDGDGYGSGHLTPIDAEQSVLGGALLSRQALDELTLIIPTADCFYRPAHGDVWDAVTALHARGEPVDAVTASAELSRRGALARIGGPAYLHALLQNTPTAANASHYARIMMEAWQLRRAWQAFTKGRQLVLAPDGGLASTIIEAAEAELEHARALATPTDRALAIGDLVGELLDIIDAPATEGVPWPWVDVARLVNPMSPGQLLCIAGRPGSGKSTALTNCVEHASLTLGLPSLMVSYEMGRAEVTARIVSSQTGVHLRGIVRRNLRWEDRATIEAYREQITSAPLVISDDEHAGLAAIDQLIRRHNPVLVALDYLQIAPLGGDPNRRREALEAFSRSLKVLAKHRRVPVLIGSQLNRASEARASKVPQLSDLRESGAIEQDCDGVILLHREDLYVKDGPRSGEADFIIAKQRNGPTDTVTLAARLHVAKFSDMA